MCASRMDFFQEEDLYGQNAHFNFGKKTTTVEETTHNPRPDFEKVWLIAFPLFVDFV